MTTDEPQPETAQDPVPEPEEDKVLEDLDPEEEEAAGVQGGIRIAGARKGRAGSL